MFVIQIEREHHKKHVIRGWGEQVEEHEERLASAREEQRRFETQMELERQAALEKERLEQEAKLQEQKELAVNLKDQVKELKEREAEVRKNVVFEESIKMFA